jgi:predicted O-linked N-acetylglucosamine transferase (SPINDLY family)
VTALRSAEAIAQTLGARIYRCQLALKLSDWRDWDQDVAAITAPGVSLEAVGDPLRLMLLPTSAERLRSTAEKFVAHSLSKAGPLPPLPVRGLRPQSSERIRIGYLSPDFREHPVGGVLAEVFELHDTSRFEIFAYAWGPIDASSVRARIRGSCAQFLEVGALSDSALAQRLRDDRIDVAVDLAGHTLNSRPLALATRPAPVQVSWLGFPGTTGASYVDYVLADAFIVPSGAERNFTEQVIRLPATYLPFDRKREVASPRAREEYGLPHDALVLGCFGQIRKINPPVFDVWMRALQAVPQAILWLASEHPTVIANLRREAAARGVSPDRLVFASRVAHQADHLARYAVMDLALDTFPYGSHSTAAEALWAGCPLAAVAGDTFVSRVSGSVVRAAGFPELVASTLEEYGALILSLAQNRSELAALRIRVRNARDSSALFDTPRFVRGLEQAYAYACLRYQRGEPPASGFIPPPES